MSMYGVVDHRIDSVGPSMTKQSMKDECDVDLIMARFVKTGFISHLASGVPSFVDVSEMTDYRSALEHVRSVEVYFNKLPADVRDRFRNDTVLFMEFLESGSEEELRTLGLEALGERRARSRDAREGDKSLPDVVPDPEVTPDPVAHVPT